MHAINKVMSVKLNINTFFLRILGYFVLSNKVFLVTSVGTEFIVSLYKSFVVKINA